MKIKIGIELEDKSLDGVDLSHPENGNDGVGGTAYSNVMLAYLLSNIYEDKYAITLYHENENVKIPDKCFSVIGGGLRELLISASENKEDIYICTMNKDKTWYDTVASLSINIVIWSQCYIEKIDELRAINKLNQIKRVVCISHEACDFYYDDDIHKKMAVIYPTLPNEKKEWTIRSNEAIKKKTVTYIGSLVPQKGFGILASIWPDIVKKVPDAKLMVIGSGKLYNRNQTLGKYGIAESSFEDSFMRYLTNENGSIIESVSFCGLVDSQRKDRLMLESSVGVVNPSAKTETCCMCAVEFESRGVPVATKGAHALVETVQDKRTGLLSITRRRLAKNIIKLLENEDLNRDYGKNAIVLAENFVPEKHASGWNQLLQGIYSDSDFEELKILEHYCNDRKWIKYINHFIRRKMRFSFLPSVFEWDYYFMSMIHIFMNGLRKIYKSR